MKKAALPLLVLAVALTGCATPSPAERSAAMEREIDDMIQVFGPACSKLGFQADSDDWRNCILKLNSEKNLERYQSRATSTHCWSYRGIFRCSAL